MSSTSYSMFRPDLFLLFILGFLGFSATRADADESATWIWSAEPREPPTSLSFSHTFSADGETEQATLRLAGDFCSARLEINGRLAAMIEPYDDHAEVEVKGLLRQGENRILVEAAGVDGPSAIAVQIDAAPKGHGGKTISIRSGADWSARPTGSRGAWRPVSTFGRLASLRWRDPNALPGIGAFDEYNQWKEALGAAGDTTAATFSKLPDGFEIDVLRVATDADGSWVSMAFDEKGRIILSREKRGLLRATLAEDGKSVAEIEVVEDTLLECRGLLFANGSLYANANNSKALHRLRDTTGDGKFDEVTKLKSSGGGVGHGRNDLALGPDGAIFAIHGDSVQIPPGSKFLLPPTAEEFRREGHLVRTDAEGKTWEIVAAGLRNPFGIDFNPDGEAFTYDADNESDIGLPFYRPTRVNHLVSGVDFGWRQGGRSWPVHVPDSLPTTVDIGHGSPTAVKFGARSHFPNRFRDALFILDWAYGRIIAVDTIARGASYACRAHTFLRGRPLNVTDLDFGPDGAMYFVTGGRKTRSALYRVRYTGKEVPPMALTEQEKARAEFSAKARATRRSLEELHRDTGKPGDVEARIWPELGNSDPWIRQAARIALEHQPAGTWQELALTKPPQEITTVSALLALARIGGDDVLPKVVGRLLQIDFQPLARADQLTVLRCYEICRRRNCPIDEATSSKIVRQMNLAFPSHHPAVNRELARILVDLGAPDAVRKCLDQLARAENQPDQLFYLDLLSRAGRNGGWTMENREAYFHILRTARTFSGDRSLPGFIAGIRKRAQEGLSEAESKALAKIIEWKEAPEAVPDPAASGRKVVKNWTLADLREILERRGDDRTESIERGREIFAAALCVRCHQVGRLGTPAGPNLTAASNRFSRRNLLEAIVDPSLVVAEIFQNHVVTKKDGTVLIGRIINNNLRKSAFTIATDPFAPWHTTEVSKHDVATHEISPASPMPAGLLNTFTLDQIRDLVAFIESGGTR